MTLESELFLKLKPDREKMKSCGFVPSGSVSVYRKPFMDGQFEAEVTVDEKGNVSGRVMDTELGEEYVLVHAHVRSSFAAEVRSAYLEILEDLAHSCFVPKDYLTAQAEYAADLIGGRLFDLQGQPEIAGVFAEIPVSGEDDLLADAFRHEGFELNFGGGGVLTFPLGQLDTGKLMKNVRGADILPLAYADDDILRRITARIQADPRPVPVDLPIPWDSYDPVLSMIRMEGGVPAGLVLVERGRNRLTVSLCYDSGAEGVLKLISALAEQALETEEQDTEILVAVVQRKLYSVVKHLVPEAAQTALMKAYLPFVHRLPFERYAFRTQETEEGTDHA